MKRGTKIAIGVGSAVVGLTVLYFVLRHFGVFGLGEGKAGATGKVGKNCDCGNGKTVSNCMRTCEQCCAFANKHKEYYD